MARIIKEAKLKEQRIVHSFCGTEVGYLKTEISDLYFTNYPHSGVVKYEGFACPKCKKSILLNKDGTELIRD